MPQVVSPITQAPCSWWSFNMTQLKVSPKGEVASVSKVMMTSEYSWMFLDTSNYILALSIADIEKVESINTFSWTGVIDTDPSPRLQIFLNSRDFLEQAEKQSFLPCVYDVSFHLFTFLCRFMSSPQIQLVAVLLIHIGIS